ncbi:hypothetical protein [Actinomadura rayongensis]|uniref:Uncharacterized protein n=1 Tax=Actinomadura rayongensis TaxID=1429076 RepID=A0A6I4WE39_9ACTN|nr:hypothetical protein [Actinomadura rayongensis]
MITALVLASLAGALALWLPRLLRTAPAREEPGGYPESMTAELDPGDEEYLAWLADQLWPDDEYLDAEPRRENDGEESGGMFR